MCGLLLLLGGLPVNAPAQGHVPRARAGYDFRPLALEVQASRVEGVVFFVRPQHWAPLGDAERYPRDGGTTPREPASDADWHWVRLLPDSAARWLADARRLLNDEATALLHARATPLRLRGWQEPPPPSGPSVLVQGVDGGLLEIGVDTIPILNQWPPGGAFFAFRTSYGTGTTRVRVPRATAEEVLNDMPRVLEYAGWQAPHQRPELGCEAPADGEPNVQPPTLVRMPTPKMNPQFPYRMQVFFEFLVDERGRVLPASVRELHGDAARWSTAVQRALVNATFRPARVDGEPVISCVRRGWTFKSRFFP